MKFNLSEQISHMNVERPILNEDAGNMDVTSIIDSLKKNEKLAEYVSWVVFAYKQDKLDLLKKMVEMFKREGFGTTATGKSVTPPVESTTTEEQEEPVEETPMATEEEPSEEPAEETNEEE